MATNIVHTVNDILQIVSDLRGESTVNSDSSRIRFVSRANMDFARRKFWKFYLLPNQTVVGSGVNSYSIGTTANPMRYKGLTEVFVAATSSSDKTTEEDRCPLVDFNIAKNLYNRSNTNQFAYEWFDSANDAWKMYINPAPKATETITYSYYWEPKTLTATTDSVLCPNPKIIALLASADLHDSEDEREIAKEEKNEAEMLINEVVGLDNSPAINQTYAMSNVESGVSGHGIGTY